MRITRWHIPSLCLMLIIIAACAETKAVVKPVAATDTRGMTDDVGYCTHPDQMGATVKLAEEIEKADMALWASRNAGFLPIAAVSPHDDYLYAAQLYVLAIKPVAAAKTVVIFGVTHKDARKVLGDPQDVLIFDDYRRWTGPYGVVDVDTDLRQAIIDGLPQGHVVVSADAHRMEHSIEAMVPFLQSRKSMSE